MRSTIFLTLINLVFFTSVNGQTLKSLPPMMEKTLDGYDSEMDINVFVKADRQAISDLVSKRLLRLHGEVDGYQLISTSISELRALVDSGTVTYVDALWAKGMPLNDKMLLNNNVLPVHQGLGPIGESIKGEGVMMGIIDTGIELSHPDFLDENNGTRVRKLWDMTVEIAPEYIPVEYGYGSLWTKAQIDAGEALLHRDQPSWYGHGSTVTGSACSDGSAVNDFMGVAPETDMAVVSFDFSRPDFLGSMAQSVEFLFDTADEVGLPCVINGSLGTYFGSHDGLDPTALYIDSLLDAQAGRLMVCAAGNSQTLSPYHLHTEVGSDVTFTWFEAESGLGSNGAGVFFELWADTAAFSGVAFSMGADLVTDSSLSHRAEGAQWNISDILGLVAVDSLINANGDFIGEVNYWGQLRGEQYQVQVYLPSIDSTALAFAFKTTGEGVFDIWSTSTFGTSDMKQTGLPTISQEAEMAHYIYPDNEQHIVSSWACSEKVITVANYINRSQYVDYNGDVQELGFDVGNIFGSSSQGPSRLGLQKPDIAASGSIALSSGDFDILASLISTEPHKVALGGLHHRNGGTSMASPVVAGVAALYLEQCPLSDWSSFKESLIQGSISDANTGPLPNLIWGNGKVDAFATVSDASIVAEISVNGNTLLSSPGIDYQWYLNGLAINGQTFQSLFITSAGAFQVEVFNENGCSRLSEPFTYVSIEESRMAGLEIYPNPSSGVFTLSGVQINDVIEVSDITGSMIYRAICMSSVYEIDLSEQSRGVYSVLLSRGDTRLVEKVVLE